MAVEVLHVRDVAAEANDRGIGKGAETFDVGEAGEGAVRRWRLLVCIFAFKKGAPAWEAQKKEGDEGALREGKTNPGCRLQ